MGATDDPPAEETTDDFENMEIVNFPNNPIYLMHCENLEALGDIAILIGLFAYQKDSLVYTFYTKCPQAHKYLLESIDL